MKKNLQTQNGFSIIEALIAIGIISIGFYAMSTFVSVQQKETRALNENLDKIDLRNLLESTLADGTVCTFEVQVSPLFLDPAKIKTGPVPSFRLTKIHSSDDAAAPAVLEVGGTYGSNASIKVQNIVLNIIKDDADPDKFTGEFVVTLDPASLVRPLKPITVQTIIYTDTTTTAPNKKIIACLSPEVVAKAYSCPAPPATSNVVVGGDCRAFSCPAARPFLAGCNLTALGSKGSFIVRYTKGAPSSIYLQEGTNCGKGGFTGTLTCSSTDNGPTSFATCPVHLGRGYSSTSYQNF